MIARSMCLLVMVGVLSGCGGHTYVRETTRTLGDDVGSLQKSLARYATAQRETASQRIDRIMKQRRQIADGDDEIAAQIAKLKTPLEGGPSQAADAQALYDGALKTARERIAKETSFAERMVSEREVLKATQAKFDPQLTLQLDALASQLRELGAAPSLKVQGEFIFEYFQSTADEVGKLEKAAKESSDRAETPTGGAGR